MSKQRTCKLVTKILRKTCASFVKIISDGENNFVENRCDKWMTYRNVLPITKMPISSTVNLHGVCLINMQIED